MDRRTCLQAPPRDAAAQVVTSRPSDQINNRQRANQATERSRVRRVAYLNTLPME